MFVHKSSGQLARLPSRTEKSDKIINLASLEERSGRSEGNLL